MELTSWPNYRSFSTSLTKRSIIPKLFDIIMSPRWIPRFKCYTLDNRRFVLFVVNNRSVINMQSWMKEQTIIIWRLICVVSTIICSIRSIQVYSDKIFKTPNDNIVSKRYNLDIKSKNRITIKHISLQYLQLIIIIIIIHLRVDIILSVFNKVGCELHADTDWTCRGCDYWIQST